MEDTITITLTEQESIILDSALSRMYDYCLSKSEIPNRSGANTEYKKKYAELARDTRILREKITGEVYKNAELYLRRNAE